MRLPSGLKTAAPVEKAVGSFALTAPVRTSQTQPVPVASTAATRAPPVGGDPTLRTGALVVAAVAAWLRSPEVAYRHTGGGVPKPKRDLFRGHPLQVPFIDEQAAAIR